MPERSDYQALLDRKVKEKAKANERGLRQLAQAVLPVDAVTKSEEWNYFLSLLQSELETLAVAINTLQEAQLTDPCFETAALARDKMVLMELNARACTLERVIALPQEIFEKGEKAKFALQEHLDS